MKSLHYLIVFFMVFASIFSSCIQDNNTKGPEEKKFETHIDSLSKKFTLSNEWLEKDSREYIFTEINKSILNGEATLPTITDNLVLLGDQAYTTLNGTKLANPAFQLDYNYLISDMFKNVSNLDIYGLRIYPAFIQSDKFVVDHLAYVVCVSTNYDASKEYDYRLIDPINKNSPITKLTDAGAAKLYVTAFFNSVKVNGQTQQIDNPGTKTSRFYDLTGIKAYHSANQNEIRKGSYSLMLKYGYVDDYHSKLLYNIYFERAADYAVDLIGFTVIMELYHDKTPFIARVGYGCNALKDGVLEIGNPCPPRCYGQGLTF